MKSQSHTLAFLIDDKTPHSWNKIKVWKLQKKSLILRA